MTGDRVVPLRGSREPVSRRTTGGLLGLQWRVRKTETGCLLFEGVHPDRPRTVVASLKTLTLPAHAKPADLMVGAQIWSDYDEGAAALMAAALEQEGETDG